MIGRLLCLCGCHRWEYVREVRTSTGRLVGWRRCTRRGCHEVSAVARG